MGARPPSRVRARRRHGRDAVRRSLPARCAVEGRRRQWRGRRCPARVGRGVGGSGGAAFPLQVTGTLEELVAAPDLDALPSEVSFVVPNALTLLERYEPSAI